MWWSGKQSWKVCTCICRQVKLVVSRGVWEAAMMLAAGDVVRKATWCPGNFHLECVYSQRFSFQLMLSLCSELLLQICKVGEYFELFMMVGVKDIIYFMNHYRKNSHKIHLCSDRLKFLSKYIWKSFSCFVKP